MQLLLIADRDNDARRQMAEIFGPGEYQVIEANSVDMVLHEVLKRDVRVVLLGSEFDGLPSRELIPLLKKCKRDLTIILVSNDESLPLIRRFRREGIFYHSLKPINEDDKEELRQVVHCAFENSSDKRCSTGAFRDKPGLKEHPA